MPTAAFESPVALQVTSYDRIGSIASALLRRFGSHEMIVTHAGRAAGWTRERTFAIDDGTTTVHTPIQSTRLPSLPVFTTSDATATALVIANAGDRLAEVALDGAVRMWAALPDRYDQAAALAGDRIALLARGNHVLVIAREGSDRVRPLAAFAAPGACAIRALSDGRVLLVGREGPSVLEAWWCGDDDVRIVARFTDLGDPLEVDVATDETAEHFERPTWPCVWDIDQLYEVHGADAVATIDRSALEAPAPAPLPEAPAALPALAERTATKPKPPAPPAVPGDVDPDRLRDGRVAALIRAIQRGARRAAPDPALVDLLSGRLPDELRALVQAIALHQLPVLALGEMWLGTPRLDDRPRARGPAPEAIWIGTIANGDDVVARIRDDRADIVELSHEDGTERSHGGLAAFLAHCAAYAAEAEEATCLDDDRST